MVVNNVTGHEYDIINYISSCLEKIYIYSGRPDLVKIQIKNLKKFTSSFNPNEINPLVKKANLAFNNNLQYIEDDLNRQKVVIQNSATLTAVEVEKELEPWPDWCRDPNQVQQTVQNNIDENKFAKGISAVTKSKLSFKITAAKTKKDLLYLIKYFIKFYFDKGNDLKTEYDILKQTIGVYYVGKQISNCFKYKYIDSMTDDIISCFLGEDLTDETKRNQLKGFIIELDEMEKTK